MCGLSPCWVKRSTWPQIFGPQRCGRPCMPHWVLTDPLNPSHWTWRVEKLLGRREGLQSETVIAVIILKPRTVLNIWSWTCKFKNRFHPQSPRKSKRNNTGILWKSLSPTSHRSQSKPRAAMIDLWRDHRLHLEWQSHYTAVTFWYASTTKPAGAVKVQRSNLKHIHIHGWTNLHMVSGLHFCCSSAFARPFSVSPIAVLKVMQKSLTNRNKRGTRVEK